MAENNNIISKMLSRPSLTDMKAKTDPALMLKADSEGFNSIIGGMMNQSSTQAKNTIGKPMSRPDQPRTREKMSNGTFERKQVLNNQGAIQKQRPASTSMTTSKSSSQSRVQPREEQFDNNSSMNEIQTGSSNLINPMERPDLADAQGNTENAVSINQNGGDGQVAETQVNETEPRVINAMNGGQEGSEESQVVNGEPRILNAMDNSQDGSEESQIVNPESENVSEIVAALDSESQEDGEVSNSEGNENRGRVFNVMSENGNEENQISSDILYTANRNSNS